MGACGWAARHVTSRHPLIRLTCRLLTSLFAATHRPDARANSPIGDFFVSREKERRATSANRGIAAVQ